tara:strand:- start:3680 stop:3886 length:207 start_codon:yes stop_codon:yes gene_type:complete
MMHILKIKGTKKIPNFVQIRDEKLSLIAYFRLDHIQKGLKKNNISDQDGKLEKIIKSMEFGKIYKYNG